MNPLSWAILQYSLHCAQTSLHFTYWSQCRSPDQVHIYCSVTNSKHAQVSFPTSFLTRFPYNVWTIPKWLSETNLSSIYIYQGLSKHQKKWVSPPWQMWQKCLWFHNLDFFKSTIIYKIAFPWFDYKCSKIAAKRGNMTIFKLCNVFNWIVH